MTETNAPPAAATDTLVERLREHARVQHSYSSSTDPLESYDDWIAADRIVALEAELSKIKHRYDPRPGSNEVNTITTTGRIPLETTEKERTEYVKHFEADTDRDGGRTPRADFVLRLLRDVPKLQNNIEEFLAHWSRDHEFWVYQAQQAKLASSNATAAERATVAERARAAACVRYCGECDCPKLTENAIKSGETH